MGNSAHSSAGAGSVRRVGCHVLLWTGHHGSGSPVGGCHCHWRYSFLPSLRTCSTHSCWGRSAMVQSRGSRPCLIWPLCRTHARALVPHWLFSRSQSMRSRYCAGDWPAVPVGLIQILCPMNRGTQATGTVALTVFICLCFQTHHGRVGWCRGVQLR